jgi:hypothetical protein
MKKVFALIIFMIVLLVGNASVVYCAWTTILGTPNPPFGITTTHTMYEGKGYTYDYSDDQTGPVPYRIGTTCGPYTHYIDPGHPNATDVNNPNGTESKPRVTRPNPPFAAGTVLYFASGTYTNIGFGPLKGHGTADKPIFIRGSETAKPTIVGYAFASIETDYIVIENIKFDLGGAAKSVLRIGTQTEGARTHIAIRNCEFTNGQYDPTSSYQVIRIKHDWNTKKVVQNIVLYNNYFHHIGDGRTTSVKRDAVGISIDINAESIWIIDNTFHKIGGDAIQIAGDSANDITTYSLPKNIYIGRNTATDMFENFLCLKACTDVIVSQNTAYNFGPVYGSYNSDSAIFRYGTGGLIKGDYRGRVWTLFNKAYNFSSPDGAFLTFSKSSDEHWDEMYFIGNIAYNGHAPAGNATAFGQWLVKRAYWVNNTAYNCDRGAILFTDLAYSYENERLTFVNNILGELNKGTVSNHMLVLGGTLPSIERSAISNNIFYESSGSGKIRVGIYTKPGIATWRNYTHTQFAKTAHPTKAVGSMETDPLHVNAANGDFRLTSKSPGINAGLQHTYYETFYSRYGIDIRKDFAGSAIPLGGIDIGAYEYLSSISEVRNLRVVPNPNQ